MFETNWKELKLGFNIDPNLCNVIIKCKLQRQMQRFQLFSSRFAQIHFAIFARIFVKGKLKSNQNLR